MDRHLSDRSVFVVPQVDANREAHETLSQ